MHLLGLAPHILPSAYRHMDRVRIRLFAPARFLLRRQPGRTPKKDTLAPACRRSTSAADAPGNVSGHGSRTLGMRRRLPCAVVFPATTSGSAAKATAFLRRCAAPTRSSDVSALLLLGYTELSPEMSPVNRFECLGRRSGWPVCAGAGAGAAASAGSSGGRTSFRHTRASPRGLERGRGFGTRGSSWKTCATPESEVMPSRPGIGIGGGMGGGGGGLKAAANAAE